MNDSLILIETPSKFPDQLNFTSLDILFNLLGSEKTTFPELILIKAYET